MNRKAIFFILFFFLVFFTLYGDERSENIDVYIVLDKSLSMVEEIKSVKTYVIDALVDKLLIPGDNFTLIPFFGKASVIFSGRISSKNDKIHLEKIVASLQANGHFTDIGNALDTLNGALKNTVKDNRRKYLLLITDGKQEAPPESKYYSPDHSFNHKFLENVKIIQKKGWKIEILGIGTESAAKELAEKLSGTYSEVSKRSTPEEIKKKIGDFLGTVRTKGSFVLKRHSKNGNAVLSFTLVSKGYDKPVDITIKGIRLVSDHLSKMNILSSPYTLTILPDSEKLYNLKVHVPVSKKGYNGELTFTFKSGVTFSPAVQNIYVEKVVNYALLLYTVLVAILLCGIIIYIVRHNVPRKDNKDENNLGNNE